MKITIYTVSASHDGQTELRHCLTQRECDQIFRQFSQSNWQEVMGKIAIPENINDPLFDEFIDKRGEFDNLPYIDTHKHEVELGEFAIVLEGGLVSSVVTDGPIRSGIDIVDYDTEGVDEDNIELIRQPDGNEIGARVYSTAVDHAAIKWY